MRHTADPPFTLDMVFDPRAVRAPLMVVLADRSGSCPGGGCLTEGDRAEETEAVEPTAPAFIGGLAVPARPLAINWRALTVVPCTVVVCRIAMAGEVGSGTRTFATKEILETRLLVALGP